VTATAPQRTASLEPISLGPLSRQPLVSVLVSNYNYAAYLPETIESVLAQSYGDWELIVCDDGSTDHSREVVSRYAERDPRIRLIAKENGGHASGLNAAFRVAQGEIVSLLDSDDLFLPEKLARLVECCALHPDCGLIVHRVLRVTQDRKKQGVWPLTGELPEGWWGPRALGEAGIVPYLPPTSGLSLRREVAERLFPLPVTAPVHICPDQTLMRLAPLVTPVARLQDALAEQRLHQSNTYGAHRTTVATVSREMMLMTALWGEQRALLAAIDERLAAQLAPIGAAQHMLLLAYVRAKLSRDPDVRSYYARYMKVLKADPYRRHVGLWRASLYFPVWLFERLLNIFFGQNRIKQWLARARGAA
jgi:glycosyltransferase involved in cell wall biosynthesis